MHIAVYMCLMVMRMEEVCLRELRADSFRDSSMRIVRLHNRCIVWGSSGCCNIMHCVCLALSFSPSDIIIECLYMI